MREIRERVRLVIGLSLFRGGRKRNKNMENNKTSSLFIIGNGFDISHSLKTNYNDFKKYLIKRFEIKDPDSGIFDYVDLPSINSKTLEYNEEEIVMLVIDIINKVEGKKWSDLEKNLSLIDFSMYLEEFDEPENFKEIYLRNDEKSQSFLTFLEIKKYFRDWIKSIKIEKEKHKNDFQKLLNIDSDKFLNFNYTSTLEIIYGINKEHICYLHGNTNEKDELYFGHGEEIENYKEKDDFEYDKYETQNNIIESLKKDTNEVLKRNKNFFSNLKNIGKIYSYGFSYGKVDLIYIEKICKEINTSNVVWYFNDFDSEAEIKKYIEIIKKSGFRGKISTFHIER